MVERIFDHRGIKVLHLLHALEASTSGASLELRYFVVRTLTRLGDSGSPCVAALRFHVLGAHSRLQSSSWDFGAAPCLVRSQQSDKRVLVGPSRACLG